MHGLDKATGSPPSLFIGFSDTFKSDLKVGEGLGVETHNGDEAVICPIVDAGRRIAAELLSSQGRRLAAVPFIC
jgi:hypothetical protein